MTQLVELQRALGKFEAAGIKLYAVSYDEVDGLAAFAQAHGIGFPLLSDSDSAVIQRFGILNTIIQPGEALYYGIPYPGTYVVDEDGIVLEKFFSRHNANRESPESMIDGALGEILIGPEEPQASGGDDDVSITAALHGGGGVLRGGARRRIVVRFELRPGLHIYGPPVPSGMVATSIDVEGPPGLVVLPAEFPPTEPLRLQDLGVDLEVWSGVVDVSIPVHANSELVPMLRPLGKKTAEITVTVRYQACDDATCLIPRTERLQLEVPLEEFLVLDIGPFEGSGQTSSRISPQHMFKLLRRGVARHPVQSLAAAAGVIWRWLRRVSFRKLRRSSASKRPKEDP